MAAVVPLVSDKAREGVQWGEDGVRRRNCGIDCVQSDIRAFGITGDWKATAFKAKVWVETVAEGGRRVGGGSWRRGGKKR